jgi:NAD-dependent DNA ligase
MFNMSVTFTSIARDERTRLREMVKLMGGEATGDLTLKTTHLICGEVKSLKYKIAAKANIPIILPSWVDYIWKQVTTQDRIFVANTEDIV